MAIWPNRRGRNWIGRSRACMRAIRKLRERLKPCCGRWRYTTVITWGRLRYCGECWVSGRHAVAETRGELRVGWESFETSSGLKSSHFWQHRPEEGHPAHFQIFQSIEKSKSPPVAKSATRVGHPSRPSSLTYKI